MSSDGFEKAVAGFRQHLPDLDSPRFTKARDQDAYEYTDDFRSTKSPPWLHTLTKAWEELLNEPFVGVTSAGDIIPHLFPIQDEDVLMEEIVRSVETVQSQLTDDQKEKVQFPINAKEWRAWSNPEFLLRPLGLRLEEVDEQVARSILAVVQSTFSPEGYAKALAAMRINGYLGQLCNLRKIMNEYSYNFLLFGTPSTTNPWGWSFYGHHLCLNVFLRGKQIVISPTFTGAEPNVIDQGPFSGTAILHTEGDLGLALMQSLSNSLQQEAQIYELLRDPGMLQTGNLKKDQWNPDDQRHVCGAFRDNRVVPYEGISVSEFDAAQQLLVMGIVEEFCLYLPQTARKLRLELVKMHLGETYFCWIGSWGPEDAYYYRIQSPVIIVEFDHHSGVFLSNEEPAKFHTHTILRTPNAGDYGNAFREADDKVQ